MEVVKGKISNWLSAGWWAGAGVIVALAAPLAVNIYKSSVGPTSSQFEKDLRKLSEEEDLVLHKGVTLELSQDQSKMRLRKFKLESQSVLILPSTTSVIEIYAKEAEIQSGAQILVKHVSGADGGSGANGGGVSDCKRGTNGGAGKNGKDGSAAPSFAINVVDLILQDDIKVNLRGNDGGSGGNGGAGGKGGRADRSDKCRGGNGGNGGTGGVGGKGGNGGTLSIHYVNAFTAQKQVIGIAGIQSSFSVENDGGDKGSGGAGGAAGAGGAKRGPVGPFGVGAQPGGSNGSVGVNGKSGVIGKDGGEIELVHEFFVE